MFVTPSPSFKQLVHGLLDVFLDRVRGERLIPEPIQDTPLHAAFDHYLESRSSSLNPLAGFELLTDSTRRAASLAADSLWRLAHERGEFAPFETELCHFFPSAKGPGICTTTDQSEAMVNAALADRPHPLTTMILEAGCDSATVQLALVRGDHVIAVDHDPKALEELRGGLSNELSKDPSRVVFETTSHTDPDFNRRYVDQVDLVYFLYPYDFSGLVAAVNAMKSGALLVIQQTYDASAQILVDWNRSLGEGEFSLIGQFQNTTPPYRTPWSPVYPTGNHVGIFQRSPDSRLAGRILLQLRTRVGEPSEHGGLLLEIIRLPG